MIDYGQAPTADEIEVTLFGPGYGEAIAVHMGMGQWMLVDSCIDPVAKRPATIGYFQKLRISPDSIKVIVASHWHDDHVRGLAEVAKTFHTAELYISSALSSEEAFAFLVAHDGTSSAGLARGAQEVVAAIKSRNRHFFAHQRTILFEDAFDSISIRATAFSPVHSAMSQCILSLAQQIPGVGSPMNHATVLRPNIESIVVHIEFGADAILLGADLEEHTKYGWSAVTSDNWCAARQRATYFKVAHHGSKSAENPQIWTRLLQSEPMVALTPFSRGGVRLPTDEDRSRIRGHAKSGGAFCSSNASQKPEMDAGTEKRLKQICRNLRKADSGFGAVRMRRRIGASHWTVETFGAAGSL